MKINYQKVAEATIAEISKLANKPRILMHVCCGPCTTAPLLFLSQYFEVTLLFANSNIFPAAEYIHRLEELKRFLIEFAVDYGPKIELLITEYRNEEYTKNILAPFKDEPEGGKRCEACFRARMTEAYQIAADHNFDYFVTVMTISRQKDSQLLNQIGHELSLLHPNTKYFHSDFKKHGGQEKRDAMVKEFELYTQDYCGCVYSLANRERRLAELRPKTDKK